jgi:uncharacterized membrane protein
MHRMAALPRDETTVDARITIRRPVGEVFRFYRNFANLPRFLGDVMSIEPISSTRSRWTIQGPLGVRLKWMIRVTAEQTNELICYETVSLPGLKTYWEIHFARGTADGETVVRELMKAPLGRVGRAALALMGRFPAEEVAANLHRLQQLLETDRVTDTSYAVAGKFA